MLLSAVSVLVVAQSSSEIPEGLMNNPVLFCMRNKNVANKQTYDKPLREKSMKQTDISDKIDRVDIPRTVIGK